MILSDKDLKKALDEGKIKVDPLFPNSIQPASIDVHLGADFLVFKNTNNVCIDPKEPIDQMMEPLTIDEDRQFILHPGEFALGMTYETLGVPNDMVLQLNGYTSLSTELGVLIDALRYLDLKSLINDNKTMIRGGYQATQTTEDAAPANTSLSMLSPL